jgi:hypothetical protein
MNAADSTAAAPFASVVYTVDGSDRIVSFNDAFPKFAEENRGSSLGSETIGRSIWDYIADEGTREVYRTLMARVRQQGESISIPFRCDAPELRRVMTMTIKLCDGNAIEFTAATERVEPRQVVHVLRIDAPRNEEFIRMCSMCKRVDAGGEGWQEVEVALPLLGYTELQVWPRISHGVCPVCFDEVFARG